MSTRVQLRQIRTRARLLRCAYDLMSEKGVGGTSIQEVTDAADIGFGTFYNYFASKEELAENVLDCIINNLGQRNRRANLDANVVDPLAVISHSVRLTAQEMRTNPVWRWWLRRTDLMVRRMNLGFRPFGFVDIKTAVETGQLVLPDDDVDTAWTYLIWLLAGTITEIKEGTLPVAKESPMAAAILRVMGVPADRAETISRMPLPPYPSIPVDFSFRLEAGEGVSDNQ